MSTESAGWHDENQLRLPYKMANPGLTFSCVYSWKLASDKHLGKSSNLSDSLEAPSVNPDILH